MEIGVMDNLKIETNIPLQSVEQFWFSWKPCCHAILNLEGYINRNVLWNDAQVYDSRIKIYVIDEDKITIIYHGYVSEAEVKNVGGTSRINLKAMSASCLLDRKLKSCSFQNTEKTYGEIVRENVQCDGGQVIRNQKSDARIEYPVIRYEETTWQFANRMAGRLGNYIIPDVETGNPNLWFGMRMGRNVESLSETQCRIEIKKYDGGVRICYKANGRSFYKIGDRMEYFGQKVTIVEVEGCYKNGELVFSYTLEESGIQLPRLCEAVNSGGLGFWGEIKEVKGEMVKVALDIDRGEETGDYFYPWYPETGNGLYAMPEVGARALLCFLSAGEQNGAVIHCVNKDLQKEFSCKNRFLILKNGNKIDLTRKEIGFSRKDHELILEDNVVAVSTLQGLKITAEGKVHLKAKQIMINTPEELNLCQG